MKWSFQIGKLFGIPIRVHVTFFLLLFFVSMNSTAYGFGSALASLVFILILFGCVVIHEIAHSLVSKSYGVNVRDILLLPIGGVSEIEEIPREPKKELLISVAGPLTSLVLAGIFFALNRVLAATEPYNIIFNLFRVNLILGLFNLLPAFPMDGGRVLRGILGMRMDFVKATRISVMVGQFFALIMFFIGVFYNWWLALIALFIYIGGEGESRITIIKSILHSIPINKVMITDMKILGPEDTLESVLEILYHTMQQDFPVVENSQLVGILRKEDISKGLKSGLRPLPVRNIMTKDYISAIETESAEEIYDKMRNSKLSFIPVLEGKNIKGFINLEQIGKYFMFYQIHENRH